MATLSFLSKIAIGILDATAWLHLPPGKDEPGGAPLKLTPGELMSVLEANAIEFDGEDIYITIGDSEKIYLTDFDGTQLTDFDGTDLYIYEN